jgi:NAD(P)-dependent dehydrogenase (short-subunit alcohol dehydrogenase family)
VGQGPVRASDIEQGAADAPGRGGAAGGGRPTASYDVRSLEAVQAMADAALTLGGVHIVFNNAGVAVGGPISEMSHDDWRWIIDVDLWGPIHGVEAFLPHMRAAKAGGHILFTASFAGLVPNVGLGPYCVAKYGVVALRKYCRELRDDDIGVSVLCPMRVGTNTLGTHREARYGGGEASPQYRIRTT